VTRLAAFALLLGIIALALSCLALMEAKATNNGLPLVHASVQMCPQSPLKPNKPNFHPFSRKADNA
jgi:hypothetical protein